MKNSILWKIIRKLTPKEANEIEAFLNYPLFNKRKDVVLLFKYLKKARISSKLPMNKKKIFEYIYPEKKFDASTLRYTMSYLLKNIKQYLVYRQVEKQPELYQLNYCKSILNKNVNDIFEKEWKSACQLLNKQIPNRGFIHLYKFQFHELYYEYMLKHARQGDMHLQEISDELTMFYLIQTLRHKCFMLAHQNVATKEYEQVFFEEVLTFISQDQMKDNFLLKIYYHCYHISKKSDNISHFQEIKEWIEKYWTRISIEEIRDIYLLVINYCIRQVNNGKKEFRKETFYLFKSGLKRSVFLEEGLLSRFTYKNIATSGLIARQNEWVYNFLENYKQHLHPIEREITFQYNLANYYFRLSDYEKAMNILRNVEFKNDIFYNLDIRRMLLRIYYELDHYDALESLLDSFTTYIKRHKNLGYHRENYLNLIKIVKSIIRQNIKNPKIRKSLIEKVNHTKALTEREWLLSILNYHS